MGTYNIPRNLRGETRILYIFSVKSLITTAVGALLGSIFYLIFAAVGIGNVGIVLLIIFALIGFGIGTVKIPFLAAFPVTKKIGGDSLDEIIRKYIKFKMNRKIYVYTKEEEK